MIKSVVTDFSKVLLFAKDPNYSGGLNALNNKLLSEDPNYSFGDYFTLNDELLEYYSRLNSKVPVYVFTSETIQDHPAIKTKIKNAFSGVMSAKKLHLSKSDSDAYQSIADQVHCLPGEVLSSMTRQQILKRQRVRGCRYYCIRPTSKIFHSWKICCLLVPDPGSQVCDRGVLTL